MTILDWILIGLAIVFAWAGWRRGFVAGLLSFAGFLGGAILSALVLPRLVDALPVTVMMRVVIVGVGVLAGAFAGQLLASVLGGRLRSWLTWKPIRFVDNILGSVLNVIALALVVWILAMALALVPVASVAQQVNSSKALAQLDAQMPPQVRNAFDGLRNLIAASDAPRVFSGLTKVEGPEVSAPDDSVVANVVEAARPAIVRIGGSTPECSTGVSGSGFIVAPQVVLTNAHVVAGVRQPLVRVRSSDASLPATVVAFDPALDVAVLRVPGLQGDGLRFSSTPAGTGDDAVIAGFPGGGPFEAAPARIRALVDAVGDDIYGQAGVSREVYILRGRVLPGDSGGPLLDPDGRALGMVFGSGEVSDDVGYALAADELRPFLEKLGNKAVDTGSCRIRD